MRLRIAREKNKTEEPIVELELFEYKEGEITVRVKDAIAGNLLTFTRDGYVRTIGYVDRHLGFKQEEDGSIMVKDWKQ